MNKLPFQILLAPFCRENVIIYFAFSKSIKDESLYKISNFIETYFYIVRSWLGSIIGGTGQGNICFGMAQQISSLPSESSCGMSLKIVLFYPFTVLIN